jgi:hypothetical protein
LHARVNQHLLQPWLGMAFQARSSTANGRDMPRAVVFTPYRPINNGRRAAF